MVDEIVLLLLLSIILVVVTLEFFIIRKMRTEKQQKKVREELLEPNIEKAHECPHSLGYLIDHPKDKPVPDECFGCRNAMKCMNTNSKLILAASSLRSMQSKDKNSGASKPEIGSLLSDEKEPNL